MATGVHSWSQTASSNQSADTAANWAEGQAPATINDSARGMMTSVAKWRDDNVGMLVAGRTGTTVSAFTLTTNQGIPDLTRAFSVEFTVASASTGTSATMAIDGLAATPLRKAAGVAIGAGDLVTGVVYRAVNFPGAGELIVNKVATITSAQVTTALGYTPIATAGGTFTGDIVISRTATPTLGTLYFGNTGTRYLDWNGSTFTLNGPLSTGNIAAGTFNGYTPFNAAAFTQSNVNALYGYVPFNGAGYGTPSPSYPGSTVVGRDGSGRAAFASPNVDGNGYVMVDSTYGGLGALTIGSGFLGITITGTACGISFFTSDEIFKKNIAPPTRDGLADIVGLRDAGGFVSFDWESGYSAMGASWTLGTTSQRLQAINPEWASPLPDGTLKPNENKMLVSAMHAIGRLAEMNAALEARLTSLEAKDPS